MDDENHLDQSLENGGLQDSTIHISDVIEVIETDPDFQESTMNGGGQIPGPNRQQPRHSAVVEIVEQPASKALRFRYECEGRSAGSIPGASSTPENKTFPSIRVTGYRGRAVVVVSCVTKDAPYRPHPHNLVGREGCKKGVCTLEISPETMSVTFSNLGIQCVKKKDIEAALRVREEIKVDPFMTGFGHRSQPTSIDLNAVRLCFQVFLQDERRGKFTVPLPPKVSEPIYDKKAMCDLLIVKLSRCNISVDGGREDMILLCEKVAKEDIQVRFFETQNNLDIWEAYGEFQPAQVHKQTAIWFKAPRYRRLDITEPVKVFIQLKRPSDGAKSEPLPFEYLPLDSEPQLRRKRQKNDPQLIGQENSDKSRMPFLLNIPPQGHPEIKLEPNPPSPYGTQMYSGMSPVYVPQSISPSHYNIDPSSSAQQNNQPLPSINMMMSPNWNANLVGPGAGATSGATACANQHPAEWSNCVKNDLSTVQLMDSATGLSSLLNLDNHQLQTIDVNSGDLGNCLSEPFHSQLSLTDFAGDHNMSDSLTRLANSAADKFYNNNQ